MEKMLKNTEKDADLSYIHDRRRKLNKSVNYSKDQTMVDLMNTDSFLNYQQQNVERKMIIRKILKEELKNKYLLGEAK
jgi:hypothetical protein